MLKKVLAILLSVLMVMMAVPFAVSAEGEAVATLHANGELVGEYATLSDAFVAARGYKLADNAVVTLLCDIDVGDTTVKITKGEFTIDMNGKTISGTAMYLLEIARTIIGDTADITITGNGTMCADKGTPISKEVMTVLTIENGDFRGANGGIHNGAGRLTINEATIYGKHFGVSGSVVVNGGSITSDENAISLASSGSVTINGGIVTGVNNAITCSAHLKSTLIINGGTISGYIGFGSYQNTTITGGTFVGSIALAATLNSVLGEDKAYWQGDTMLQVADNATRITGGDVTVKDACHHEEGIASYVDNGADHTAIYSCCNWTQIENHVFDHEFDCQCPCGSTREVDFAITFGGNSISERKNGLAFRFDANVSDMGIHSGSTNRADYTNANVNGYKVLTMGFIASNGVETNDVSVVYLCDLASDSVGFAVRIINIPEAMREVDITVTAYVVLAMDGEAVTIYSDAQTTNYADVAA